MAEYNLEAKAGKLPRGKVVVSVEAKVVEEGKLRDVADDSPVAHYGILGSSTLGDSLVAKVCAVEEGARPGVGTSEVCRTHP